MFPIFNSKSQFVILCRRTISRVSYPIIGYAFFASPNSTSMFAFAIFILTVFKCTWIPIQPTLSGTFALSIFIKLIIIVLLVIDVVVTIIIVIRRQIRTKWYIVIILYLTCQWTYRWFHTVSLAINLVTCYT